MKRAKIASFKTKLQLTEMLEIDFYCWSNPENAVFME